MELRLSPARLGAAALAALCIAPALASPLPAEDFAKIPTIQSVTMSADGKQLVAIVAAPGSDNSDTALANWNLDNLGAGPVAITPSGDRMKFIAASALKAGRNLVIGRQEWTGKLGGCGEGNSTGATKTFLTKAYLTDATQTKFDEAFANNTRTLGVSTETLRCLELAGTASLVHGLPLDADRVIISQLNEATLQANYYRFNLRTGQTELLFKGSSRTSPGLFHPRTGEVLTQTQVESAGSDDFEQRILIKNSAGQFEVHAPLTTRLSERYTVEVVGIDDDSGKLYVLTDQFSDLVQARLYDPAKKEFDKEPLAAHPSFSISSLILGTRKSNFNQVLGFYIDGPQRQAVYVDPQMKALQEGLQKAYPGLSIYITGYNDDLSRVLFTTESNRNPKSYFILADRKDVVPLGNERPWVDSKQIGEQRWVTYTARDGLQIPAILDLPPGWKQGDGPLPALVHPHGGPWARDYTGWDASGWVPFFTSRGYAVLRPQYRGSAGLGRKLWLAGDAEWGQKMQDDKDDGAAWLVSQGIAAKDRIAIFGYSYGGFAAAAATVRSPSPYQCAIAGAPVTDLGRLGTSWSQNRLQRILQGRTVKGMDPMQNTAKATIPLLTFVGDRDVRTPSFHARNFYNGVQGKVPARFELIPDMPHSMPWYPVHFRTTLTLMADYLSKDCGPGGL
ncbi:MULTISPECIES: alpha/beta hydrolase family protein [Stenotrophomonas]|jgi:dienelactone hydrolase|uniref:alpha/beta hydrolase family protein n=1 Tax=Stenotrophomonas TaxID=40323 RepID=UPI00066A5DB9|nr:MULTISPECIES: prolyl oligopeptidase family serine peptidase [Stenotrophomonas]MBA0353748.1 S9 family peptidase [Stenotrophomonas maltophilia]MBH1696278.1 S9 family peptidase [Stenotrophomonas maltophilia]MDG2510338.1 prolyl oligopeptidase family serine peptidase [Stenotrophomonas maltophilia]MDH0551263.1 prolyl oligopeptidase family serine peptidase [Stenotrophomonas sp. GD04006]PJL48601.1 peptidase S9 [Stenotrophomonas maltophilia]